MNLPLDLAKISLLYIFFVGNLQSQDILCNDGAELLKAGEMEGQISCNNHNIPQMLFTLVTMML